MLRSDHRELRNSYAKLVWVVGSGGGGGWWVYRAKTITALPQIEIEIELRT